MNEDGKYRYAYTEAGGPLIHIGDVDKATHYGRRFICPNCGEKMYAAMGRKIVDHFRHLGQVCSYDGYLHSLAEKTFLKEYRKCLEEGSPFILKADVPTLCAKDCIRERRFCRDAVERKFIDLTSVFTKATLEARVDTEDGFRRPDILLESEDGRQLWVEIWVHHETDEEKRTEGSILEIRIRREDDIECFRKHLIEQSPKGDSTVRLHGPTIFHRTVCPGPVITVWKPDSRGSETRPANSGDLLSMIRKGPYKGSQRRRQEKPIPQPEPVSLEEPEWINLGLPSGTLWAKMDSGKTTWPRTGELPYGNLPTGAQAAELKEHCEITRDNDTKSLIFKGRNGNSITFCLDPSRKHGTGYWSREYKGSDNKGSYAARFVLTSDRDFWINDGDINIIESIRLVK